MGVSNNLWESQRVDMYILSQALRMHSDGFRTELDFDVNYHISWQCRINHILRLLEILINKMM